MDFTVALGPQRMHELIQASPAAPLLLPLKTALERELGHKPQVAREVDEVAQDIQQKLQEKRRSPARPAQAYLDPEARSMTPLRKALWGRGPSRHG